LQPDAAGTSQQAQEQRSTTIRSHRTL
jgi:hypothetical protein